MTETPVYPECVIGFRSWYLGLEATLWPAGSVPGAGAGVHRPWRTGPNTATCLIADHLAPDRRCGCGLYAWFEPPAPEFGFVVGAIAAWGVVQVHRDGFRAEHAQITALLEHPRTPGVRDAAARYGVPLVPRELLELEAGRHGRAWASLPRSSVDPI